MNNSKKSNSPAKIKKAVKPQSEANKKADKSKKPEVTYCCERVQTVIIGQPYEC